MALITFILTLGDFWRSQSVSPHPKARKMGNFCFGKNVSLTNVAALLNNPSL